MKPAAFLLAALPFLPAGTGCVPALREAPDLRAGSGSTSQEQAESLYRQGLGLFAGRDDAQVRKAGDLLRQAAGSLDDPGDALLALVQVLVWQVEHERNPALREELATRAVHAGQWCLEASPQRPACRYRLAIAVGVQARERTGTALDAMAVMIELLQAVHQADPGMDHGGPDRVLALLYLRAPGWPAGPGDPDLGYEHAMEAVAIDPEFPPNQLVLGEALEALDRPEMAVLAYRDALFLAGEQQQSAGRDAMEWQREAEGALSRIGS